MIEIKPNSRNIFFSFIIFFIVFLPFLFFGFCDIIKNKNWFFFILILIIFSYMLVTTICYTNYIYIDKNSLKIQNYFIKSKTKEFEISNVVKIIGSNYNKQIATSFIIFTKDNGDTKIYLDSIDNVDFYKMKIHLESIGIEVYLNNF